MGVVAPGEKKTALRDNILIYVVNLLNYKLNSVALVRERTIPTERPPPVGEVSANFWLIIAS